MKRVHVIASLVIVAEVIFSAVYYHAQFLALFAVPSATGVWVARRHPRAGAGIVALASVLVLLITVPQALGGPNGFDLAFDIICASAAAVALVDGLRTAFGQNRVTGLAGR